MKSSVIPARLQFQCGHAALVTLPRVKGETATQRNDRVAGEKVSALLRQCDFCAPSVAVLEPRIAAAPISDVVEAQLRLADLEVEVQVEVAAAAEAEFGFEPDVEPEAEMALAELIVEAIDPGTSVVELEQPQAVEVVAVDGVAVDAIAVAVEPKATRKPLVSRPRRTAAPAPAAATAPVARAAAPAASAKRFVVRYQSTLVIHAASIQDALRQAAALGAIDVLAITRQG